MKETKGLALPLTGTQRKAGLHIFFQVILKFLHRAFHIDLRTSSQGEEVN